MAAPAIMAAQLIVGGAFVSPWLGGSGGPDIVTFLVVGGSLLAGVPGSVVTHVAAVRCASAAARAAVWWTGVRAALLAAVTTAIVAGTRWHVDGELIVLAAVEIAVSFALAHDTVRQIAKAAAAARAEAQAGAQARAQRLTQV